MKYQTILAISQFSSNKDQEFEIKDLLFNLVALI